MEHTEHFGKLTQRMDHFRNQVLDEKPYIDGERAQIVTDVYKNNQHLPRVLLRAVMFSISLKKPIRSYGRLPLSGTIIPCVIAA